MKPRILVICGDKWHPAETIRRGLSSLGEAGFDFQFAEECPDGLAEIVSGFAGVVLAKANLISPVDQRPWLTPKWAAAFQKHLRCGNGLLAVHAGTSRYEQSLGMSETMGGAFLRHPDPCSVTMEPRAGCPITEGVTAFAVRDEHYFMAMNDPTVDAFLHSRSDHGVQPAGWTRITEDGGRVCVLTPGHDLEVWLHPEFQKLLLNALRWAAKLN